MEETPPSSNILARSPAEPRATRHRVRTRTRTRTSSLSGSASSLSSSSAATSPSASPSPRSSSVPFSWEQRPGIPKAPPLPPAPAAADTDAHLLLPSLPGPVPVRPLHPAQEAPLAAGPRLPGPVRGRPRPVRQEPSRRRRRDGGALGGHRRPAQGGVHDRSLPALRLVRLLQGHVLRRGGDGASPPGSLLRFARPPARFNHHRRFEIGIQTRPKLDAE
ncbi:unnamed protein product [Musa acuminata subsp. malaccensis]|uniref:(wild Malaysian banana) hypothetical protein n=1 Tax=Musa acuminata subsp. malaccensis TaxID=214687 RepID=A0A8D7FCA3_MUSAM|nr:unnamed protein product [Musa acuminata subsp. malaccensis]